MYICPVRIPVLSFFQWFWGKGKLNDIYFWGPMEQRVTKTILGNRERIKLEERGTNQYISGEQGNTHTPAFDKASMS